MRPPRKYQLGTPFETFHEMVTWLESGRWVYWPNRTRPMHPIAVLNQQCWFLLKRYRQFSKAVETEEWQEWNRARLADPSTWAKDEERPQI